MDVRFIDVSCPPMTPKVPEGGGSSLPLEESRHADTRPAACWGGAAEAGRAGMLAGDGDVRIHLQ